MERKTKKRKLRYSVDRRGCVHVHRSEGLAEGRRIAIELDGYDDVDV